MKINKKFGLMLCFILIPVFAHCQDYNNPGGAQAVSYTAEKNKEENDTNAPVSAPEIKARVTGAGSQQAKVQEKVKTKSLCIGDDCRDKWPVLRCANYQGRPAGEIGNEFCESMNQTCMAVSLGSGQGFFDECSVKASSVHKCRCCWVE